MAAEANQNTLYMVTGQPVFWAAPYAVSWLIREIK